MANDNERIYWLAWSKIKGIGPILLKRIEQHCGTLEAAWKIPINDLLSVEGIGTKLLKTIKEQRVQINPEQLFLEHRQKNPLFWTPSDPEYPQLLLEIPSFPSLLYYTGTFKKEENEGKTPLIGIVGTRQPTQHGRKWTYKISATLAKHGFVVVSGLATGIDSIAHRGCLDAGGRTIAVLGNGLDIVYPSSNRKLYQEITEKGLILSEYPAGVQPDRKNFPARNRIVAGLCRAILVMEAPEKSGALITARLANEFGRDIYSLPNSPDSLQSRGCLRLIHNGAEMIITEHELLSMLGAIPKLDQGQQLSIFDSEIQSTTTPTPTTSTVISPPPKLDPPLSTVFDVITNEAIAFDIIVEKSKLTAGEVSGILLQLELDGLISQLPGMRYQKKLG